MTNVKLKTPERISIHPSFAVLEEAYRLSSASMAAPVPLVVVCPHAGRYFPDGFEDIIVADLADLEEIDRRGDTFTDWLSMGAPNTGALQIVSNIAPAFLNVGRALDEAAEQHLYGDKGQGLVSAKTYHTGAAIYPEGRFPGTDEIEARIRRWYQPFHDRLEKIVEATKEKHGCCMVFDMHSCPQKSYVAGNISYEVILSDASGRSCDPEIIEIAQNVAQSYGYRVGVNNPYTGGFITQKFGAHANRGTQSLQMEIVRPVYGLEDQGSIAISNRSKFQGAQYFTQTFIEELARYMRNRPHELQL
ncbi:MAG: N-formylglutamate amidohydrolase [Alphaproteobacteria bacterium]|nr:N-formylglutamate amidohydrolase [Alphaproteobacteria bacterium]